MSVKQLLFLQANLSARGQILAKPVEMDKTPKAPTNKIETD